MFRRTITNGRPLVAERVSTYCWGVCVWPWSPSGNVSFKNNPAAWRQISSRRSQESCLSADRDSPIRARSLRMTPALTWLSRASASPVRQSLTVTWSRLA